MNLYACLTAAINITAKVKKSFLIFFIVFFPTASYASVAHQSLESALTSFHQQQYQESIIHLKNILKVEPKQLSARILLAENLLALGDGVAAEVELNFAVNNGADSIKITPLLAKAYLLQQKFRHVTDIHIPNNSAKTFKIEMYTLMGLAYLGERNTLMAKNQFNRVLTLDSANILALLGLAKVNLEDVKIPEAIAFAEKALAISPNDLQALLMVAILYQAEKDTDKALATVNSLLTISPLHYSGLLVRAILLIDMGKVDEASLDLAIIIDELPNEPIANYMQLLTNDSARNFAAADDNAKHLMTVLDAIPDNAIAEQPVFLFLTGLINFQKENFVNAEKAFVKYHKAVPKDPNVLKLLAQTEMALGDYFSAKRYLTTALLNDESDEDVWLLLAKVSMFTKEITKAEFYFQKVIESNPESLPATLDLAKLYLLTGNMSKVIELLTPAITLTTDNIEQRIEVHMMLVKALQETGDYSQALEISEKLLAIAPNNSYVNQLHASIIGLLGDVNSAVKYYQKAASLNAHNFQASMHLARIYAAAGFKDKAITQLTNQLKLGENSAVFVELGDVYAKYNEEADAIRWYKKALSYNSKSILALSRIVEIYLTKDDVQPALDITKKYLEQSQTPEGYRYLALLYIKVSKPEEAVESMKQYVKYSANNPVAFLNLAKLQISVNYREQAKDSLIKALAWDHAFIPAYTLLTSLYNEDKDKTNALETINKLAVVSQDIGLIEQLRGDMYWSLDDSKQAEKHYEESLSLKENQAALLGLYRIHRQNKAYKKITPLLTDWLKKYPNDFTIAAALGENYHENGQLDEAATYYEKLLAANNNNPLLLNNLAIVYSKLSKFDRANFLIEKAYKIMPKNASIIDSKAWILSNQGNHSVALSLLREAHSLDYESAEINYHLGKVLINLNRRKEAKDYLIRAVQSNQYFIEKAEAKKLLEIWDK